MHIVSLLQDMVVAGVPLKGGVSYVMNDTGAGSLLSSHRLEKCADGIARPRSRLVKVFPYDSRPLDPRIDYNGCAIWLFRSGGFGDLLLMTPTIREIKKRWPKSRVIVVTLPAHAPALSGLDCEVRTGFVPLEEIGSRGGRMAVISFEGVIEDNPESRAIHAVDLFAKHAGLDVEFSNEEMALHYVVSPAEQAWAHKGFPRIGKRRVGIQALPSSIVRTYPAALLVCVIEQLVERGIEVFLFGKNGQVECDMPGVTNLADVEDEQGRGITFRKSMAVLSTCDVVIVPDSALLHVAGALKIPAVALFGSFDAALRVIPGAPVKVLQAKADCAPCHWHESGELGKFPPDGPCQVAKCCSVLASIPPDRVVAAAVEMVAANPLAGAVYGCDKTGAVCAIAIPGDAMPVVAHLAGAEIRTERVVYDFLDHRIGDTVAAVFLLKVWMNQNPHAHLYVADRGAIPIFSHWDFKSDPRWTIGSGFPKEWESWRRLNFEFGNLWIAAPSAYRSFTLPFPSMKSPLPHGLPYAVGIHCLTGAAYNAKRNHDPSQFAALAEAIRKSGLSVYEVPPPEKDEPLSHVFLRMSACRVWIGGDTGFSHCFAAMNPDRPLIAIYPDDTVDRMAFEETRKQMRAWWNGGGEMESQWCSDPLTRNLHKFVMKDHQFDFDAVLECVLKNFRKP